MRNLPIKSLLLILAVVLWAGCADRITTAPAIANARTDSTPSSEDIWKKIDANYSQIHDLQYNVTCVLMTNGMVALSNSAVVQMKGPYKARVAYADGLVRVKNNDPSSDAFRSEAFWEGSLDDMFFWRIPQFKKEVDIVRVSEAPGFKLIDVQVAPTAITGRWPLKFFRVDYAKGLVTEMESHKDETFTIFFKATFRKPIRVAQGCWLPSQWRFLLQADGTFVIESVMSHIVINQGLADSLFDSVAK